MPSTILQQIQKAIGEWSKTNFGEQVSKLIEAPLGSLAPLLGLGEEVGELNHAVLKRHQGIRGFEVATVYEEARDDAVGDILIYLCDFCCREGIDMQTVLVATAGKVLKRDWTGNPSNADKDLGILPRLPLTSTASLGESAQVGVISEQVKRTYRPLYDAERQVFTLYDQHGKPLVEVESEAGQALLNKFDGDPRLWDTYYAGVLHALAVAASAKRITMTA